VVPTFPLKPTQYGIKHLPRLSPGPQTWPYFIFCIGPLVNKKYLGAPPGQPSGVKSKPSLFSQRTWSPLTTHLPADLQQDLPNRSPSNESGPGSKRADRRWGIKEICFSVGSTWCDPVSLPGPSTFLRRPTAPLGNDPGHRPPGSPKTVDPDSPICGPGFPAQYP